MKYVDEYRDGDTAAKLAAAIRSATTRNWTLMEVCGGQTHAIMKYGVDQLLPPGVELLHGPGCPVCVTPLEMLDRAHAIASRPDVTFCSFGDMLRVPGSRGDLLDLKARGCDIRIVYSPLDAVRLAAANPSRKVVFFAVGFETTAPPNAMAVWQARRRRLLNFSLLVSHVRVPPSLAFILQASGNRVQGFLGPGHVCTVMGLCEYEAISRQYGVPIVVSGFEPVDLLEGVLLAVRQLEAGHACVENQYARVVGRHGNPASQRLMNEVFEICDRSWRGMGILGKSGLRLRHEFREHDAERLFEVESVRAVEPSICISGQVLRGLKKPTDCTAFGTTCTPQTPLGATMVSSEGACSAYYLYGREFRPATESADVRIGRAE
jgi:hydrogenase expression/formation protein HypD